MICPICGVTLLEATVPLSGQSWKFYLCPNKCFIDYFPASKTAEEVKNEWRKKNPRLRMK